MSAPSRSAPRASAATGVQRRSAICLASLAVGVLLVPSPAPAAEPIVPIDLLLCQQAIGKEALRFVKRVHKAWRICRDADTRGQGCDPARRDAAIADAAAKLARRSEPRCDAVTLESLGFPEACDDPDGAPFTLADLVACLRDGHGAHAEAMFAIEYPAGAP